jgi:hypothetical protein
MGISTLSETGGLWGEFVNGSRYYVHYKDDDELRIAPLEGSFNIMIKNNDNTAATTLLVI